GVRVDARADVAALHPAGLEHVRAVGAVPRIGAGGLAGHLLARRGAGAPGIARPSPVARRAARRALTAARGADGGHAARAEHTERPAPRDERADVEGEALVLEVLLGVGQGAAFVLGGRCGMARGADGVLMSGREGAVAAGAGGVVHAGPLGHRWLGKDCRTTGCAGAVTRPCVLGGDRGGCRGSRRPGEAAGFPPAMPCDPTDDRRSSPPMTWTPTAEDGRRFLALAIEQATKSWDEGGVPIGAVLVHDGEVLAAGH